MARSVILGGARDSHGEAAGLSRIFPAAPTGDRGDLRGDAGRGPGCDRTRCSTRSWDRCSPPARWTEPGAAGGGGGGHPHGSARADRQQGLPPGLEAVALADQLIRAGEFDLVVAGGQESMAHPLHVLATARAWINNGEYAAGRHLLLGRSLLLLRRRRDGQRHRPGQHPLRRDPRGAGRLRRRLAPQGGRGCRRGRPGLGDRSGVRAAPEGRPGALRVRRVRCAPTPRPRIPGKLRPSFSPSGTITAGTSSPLSDGAAAVVVCSRRKAEELVSPPDRRSRR